MTTNTEDTLYGATMVRFGLFEAMMSGDLADTEAGKPTWKIWWTAVEDAPVKLLENLTRSAAVRRAQCLATSWRVLGRPKMTEAEVRAFVKQVA